MADRYLVATGTWNASNTAIWSDTDGGASGFSVPTAADDVHFTAASGAVTVTIGGANAYCRSLNCTGFTGTASHNAGIDLFIGDATAGAGNIALKFVAGMTYTPVNATSSQIQFVSTSATVQEVDFAGKTTGSVIFNATSNGNWQLTGGGTNTGVFRLTKGTLDFNGQSWTITQFLSNVTNVRSLTLGAANITGLKNWFWNASNGTLSAGSSTLTFTAPTVTFQIDGIGATTWGTVNLDNAGNVTITSASAITFGALTRTGTAVKTDSLTLNTTAGLTVSGTFTVNGNSAINRVLVASSAIGTARTITAATVTTSNTNWRDITGAGAASWDLSAITGNSGDCGGNTNITFTAATTQTATGTASFLFSTHGWTSRVPLPQDTAVISNAFVAGRTVTQDMPRMGTIDFTGSTGNVAFSIAVSGVNTEIYGHLTLRAGMGTVTLGTALHVLFMGTAQQNLTMAGNSNVSNYNIYVDRSKLQLQDAYTATSATNGIISRFSGHIDTQSFDVQCALIWCVNTSNTNLLGTSTFSLTYVGAASVIDFVGATSARMSAASATFIVNDASTNTRTVALGACSIGALTYTVANSPGILTVTGGGTIGTLNLGSGRTFRQTAGTTLNIGTALNATGTIANPGGLVLPGVSTDYASLADNAAYRPTGDLEIEAKVSLDDWTPVAARIVALGGDNTGPTTINWYLYVNTNGTLVFSRPSGATLRTFTSSAATGIADGATKWVKTTFDQDNGSAQSEVKFYLADDDGSGNPGSYTQLGTTQTNANTGAGNSNTTGVRFGASTASALTFAGTIYKVIVRNGIAGTTILDADFADKAWGYDTFTETANSGTVTINGAVAQASDGAVRFRSTVSGSAATISKASGEVSGQYLSIKDSTATGGATFYAVDSTDVSGNSGWNFITSWVPKVIYVWF